MPHFLALINKAKWLIKAQRIPDTIRTQVDKASAGPGQQALAMHLNAPLLDRKANRAPVKFPAGKLVVSAR